MSAPMSFAVVERVQLCTQGPVRPHQPAIARLVPADRDRRRTLRARAAARPTGVPALPHQFTHRVDVTVYDVRYPLLK